MAQDKRKRKDEVKQAQVVEGDEHQKTVESRKIETFLITLPTAVKKFADMPEKKSTDPKYSDSSEGPFGLGPLIFPCLQRFNNIKFFLTLCFIATLSHGMLIALVNLTIKIIISQFFPSATEIYLMESSNFFAPFLVSISVAYFGGRGNRAKWVAVASIITWLSAIVFAMIYFNYEIIKIEAIQKEDLCEEGKKPKVCGSTIIPQKSACVFLLTFGQLLHGTAAIPLYLLAITFISDHVPTLSSGLYVATADAAQTLGYIMGFLIGIKNFQLPVEKAMKAVGPVQKMRILQSGWWKAFFFVGSISLCTTLPLFCFPSSLPGAHKIRLEKSQEPPRIDRRLKNMTIITNLKSVLHAVRCLLRSPLVMTQTFCKVSEYMTFMVSSLFLPPYLQTQFLITPVHSVIFTGMFIFPGCLIGRFLGGYIVDKLEMNIKNKLKFISTVSIISVFLFLLLISVNCETAKFSGINEDYDGLGSIGNLKAPCNDFCGCTTAFLNPVCGRDDKQYFSPCFAGCSTTKEIRKEKVYYNCSCVKEGLTAVDPEGHYIDAVSGTCNTRCLTLPLFFAFYFSATVFSSLCSIPALLIIMESVPDCWNSMSLGVTFTIWRFVGSGPAPIFFSIHLAACCRFWDINECGRKVRCWIYHKETLIYIFVGMWISLQVATSLLCIYAVYTYDHVVKGIPTTVKRKKANKKEENED